MLLFQCVNGLWFAFFFLLNCAEGILPTGSDKYFPLLHYSSLIKAFDLLQTKEGIERGLSDPCVCTSSGPHEFKRASEEIFWTSNGVVGLYNVGHSDTCLLVAVIRDCAAGALAPCVRPEQN